MDNMKKVVSEFLCIALAAGVCSCENQKRTSSDESAQNSVDDSKVYVTDEAISTEDRLQTDNQKGTSADESAQNSVDNSKVYVTGKAISTEIAEERFQADNTAIKKAAEKLFEQYYDGIKNEDFEKCFSVFPDFYKKAIENENKSYNETDDEYIKSMNASFTQTYGDDYYAFITIGTTLQLYDEVLADTQNVIKESFGADAKLEDAWFLYVSQTARGEIAKETVEYQFMLLKIDGKYYLYDNYFEK